jgi:branched-chain amino acid transport system permease protein
LLVLATTFLEQSAIYILMGWAIYLCYRNAQLNNLPVLFMGIAAYFTAYVTLNMGWPFPLAVFVSVVLCTGIAFVISLRLARTTSFTMVIATIAPIIIFQTVVRNLDFLGGVAGIYDIPQVKYLLPIILVATAIVGFFIYRLDHSRVGRAMEVSFVGRNLAASLGVNVFWLTVFLHSAAGTLGGLAGAFYAPFMRYIDPRSFSFQVLLYLYCFVFVGGYNTMWGVVVFTPILLAIPLLLPQEAVIWSRVIYGALLVTVLVLRPTGVIDKKVLKSIRAKSRLWLGRITGRST